MASTNSSNPSHLLLSRHPRSPAHPQLFPTSTPRHAFHSSAAYSSEELGLGIARHTRQHSSPPSIVPGTWSNYPPSPLRPNSGPGAGKGFPPTVSNREPSPTAIDGSVEDEIIEVHPTFRPGAEIRGNIKVIVGRNEFLCHKEILWFASPFFQGLLAGSWAENTRMSALSSPRSSSPADTDTNVDLLPGTTSTDASLVANRDEMQIPLSKPSEALPGLNERSAGSSHSHEEEHDGTLFQDQDDEECAEQGSHPEANDMQDTPGYSQKASIYLDAESEFPTTNLASSLPGPGPVSDMANILKELRGIPEPECEPNLYPASAAALPALPSLLTPASPAPVAPVTTLRERRGNQTIRHSFSSSISPTGFRGQNVRNGAAGAEAESTVELHEESAAAFQDFLFWAYPHLECKVTWTNVEPLIALSTKLLVPALQHLCNHFLITHASGRPIYTLSLAEEYSNAELFREASRFVLDQPSWDPKEMEMLSGETQLRLSQKRNWFLERLLKLSSIEVRKEYQCRTDCPDPNRCQILLDEKWRQAHMAVSRLGPPQPSVAFRCLRQLETFPTNPSLVMPHPHCQKAAFAWVGSLFDRMFQFRMMVSPISPGTEKYWLSLALA